MLIHFCKYQNKVKRSCQALNFFCSIERRDRDNAFAGVFEFQTSTSLATPARQKKHIVSNRGVQWPLGTEYCSTVLSTWPYVQYSYGTFTSQVAKL